MTEPRDNGSGSDSYERNDGPQSVADRLALLEQELADARDALVWADGMCVVFTGKALADHINPGVPRALALEAAGCWARGAHDPDLTPVDPPDCFCQGIGPSEGFNHTKGECYASDQGERRG